MESELVAFRIFLCLALLLLGAACTLTLSSMQGVAIGMLIFFFIGMLSFT